MPLTLSYGIYTDSNLTTEYSGISELIHETDQSDNPQVIGPLYFGSAEESPISTKCQALSNPGVDEISLSVVDIVPEWEASTAYSVGDCVQPVGGNTYWYECTTAGTSHSSEPTWPTSGIGTTVTDNTAVWALKGKKHEETEIKLSLTNDFSGSVAGASLNLGVTVTNGTANAISFYVQVTNAVLSISNTASCPHIDIQISDLIERTN